MAASRRRESLAWRQLPCLRVDHMTPAEKRAYVLADNKLALNAGWDEELLALELKELMEADIDFDIGVTGFSIAEVDSLIEGLRRRRRAIRPTIGFPIRIDVPAALPSRRHLAARAASSDLRRRARPRCGRRPDGWREGRDGLHRPALQCRDRRQCERARQDPPSRVRDGLGRNDAEEFTAFLSPAFANLVATASTARSISSAWTGGTWARCCEAGGGELCRA